MKRYRGLDFGRRSHRDLRRMVYIRDDFTCQLCGWRPPNVPVDYNGSYTLVYRSKTYWNYLQVDHKRPTSKGGALADPANLQTLCHKCNSGKCDRL